MSVTSIDEVLALYGTWGDDRYDEEVTQLDHALQCAALAREAQAADALVAASLLHDIGHLLARGDGTAAPGRHDDRHEVRGARHLAGLFPPAVTEPIALHVRAKRYLCAVDPGYRDGLSPGSRRSLELQGGPLVDAEVVAFERRESCAAAVELRRWDDLGKIEGLRVAPLSDYGDLLEQVAGSG